MKWFNLKQNKCPSCSKDLTDSYDASSNMFKCPCGFMITTKKMKEIIGNMVNKDISSYHKKAEEERQEWE